MTIMKETLRHIEGEFNAQSGHYLLSLDVLRGRDGRPYVRVELFGRDDGGGRSGGARFTDPEHDVEAAVLKRVAGATGLDARMF